MILTKHFVFLHFPKTGGSFVRVLLDEHGPKDWEIRTYPLHPTHEDIPESHRHLPVLGATRDPWSWYVSHYAYLIKGGADREHALFNEWSNGLTAPFIETTHAMLDWIEERTPGMGAFTRYMDHTFDRKRIGLVAFAKMESLREDLLRVLGNVVDVPAALAQAIRDNPKVNTTSKAHHSTWYDDELAARIERLDRESFSFFGYPPALERVP